MNNKIDKKSRCILTITLILLISLLVNVYQGLTGIEYKKEIGNDIYISIEEIRTRNESILLTLDGCITSQSITKEEILTLYKNYNLINIAELNLWEKYLKNIEGSLFKKDNKVDLTESNPNEVFANIEDFIYNLLLNYMSYNMESIKLDEKLYMDISVMKDISNELNNYINRFMEEKLSDLEGEEKAEKIIRKGYWIDILKGIEEINSKYKSYMFKL
ncbi:hypothetical protein H9X78_05565 [Clostridium saudiense]|nr:hypothetical protein [Clostridium saudiense]